MVDGLPPCASLRGEGFLVSGKPLLGLKIPVRKGALGWMDGGRFWGAKSLRDTFGNLSVTVKRSDDPGDFSLKSLLNLIDCKNNLAATSGWEYVGSSWCISCSSLLRWTGFKQFYGKNPFAFFPPRFRNGPRMNLKASRSCFLILAGIVFLLKVHYVGEKERWIRVTEAAVKGRRTQSSKLN